jgi:hypothetical protein
MIMKPNNNPAPAEPEAMSDAEVQAILDRESSHEYEIEFANDAAQRSAEQRLSDLLDSDFDQFETFGAAVVEAVEELVEPEAIVEREAGAVPTAEQVRHPQYDDFISDYASWANVIEFPHEVHEAIAIQLVASVLNRRGVTINRGAFKYTMDLWLAILAPASGGKNTSMYPAREILSLAGIPDLIGSETWGSPEKLFEILSGAPPPVSAPHDANGKVDLKNINLNNIPTGDPIRSRFYAWTELSAVLQQLSSPAFAEAKSWFTDLYDSTQPPSARTFRTAGKDITFAHAPRTNILGFSAPSWFFKTLKNDTNNAFGGFLPRWTIVDACGGDWKDIPEPLPLDQAVASRLGEFIKTLAKLPERAKARFFDGFSERGEVPNSTCPYNVWYHATKERFRRAHPELGLTFFGRHRGHIIKLAVVYEAAKSGTVDVSPDAWYRAEQKARELEETLFKLFRTGFTDFGYHYDRAVKVIQLSKQDGMPKGDFSRIFQDRKLREDIVNQLYATGDAVLIVRSKQPGKRGPDPALWFHKDHWDGRGQRAVLAYALKG